MQRNQIIEIVMSPMKCIAEIFKDSPIYNGKEQDSMKRKHKSCLTCLTKTSPYRGDHKTS